MKRTIRILASLLVLVAMLSSMVITVAAEDISEGETKNVSTGEEVGTNNGTVETNEGTINNNSDKGTVGTNKGTVKENNGKIDTNTNKGTVKENNGDITTNDKGAVEINNDTITTNLGTVDENNGTIQTNDFKNYKYVGIVEENNGTIVTNKGHVGVEGTNGFYSYDIEMYPDETGNYKRIDTNEGTVYINRDTGSIGTNEGSVVANYGNITTNNDAVWSNSGTVKTSNEYMTLNKNYVGTNNGRIERNYNTLDINNGYNDANWGGTVNTNEGLIDQNSKGGTVVTNNAVIRGNDSTSVIKNNNGQVNWNTGKVENNDIKGIVKNFTTTVDGEEVTGVVENNYGTTMAYIGRDAETRKEIYTTEYGVQVKNTGSGDGTGLLQVVKNGVLKLSEHFKRDGYNLVGYTQEYQNITFDEGYIITPSGDLVTDLQLTKGESTVDSDEYEGKCPNILTLIWKAIAKPVSASASSSEPEAVQTGVKKTARRFKLIETVSDGEYFLASYATFSDEEIQDLLAILNRLLADSEFEFVIGEPGVLSPELAAQFFGDQGNHITITVTRILK
ncbi:MAG: hypothetical protein SPD95_04420 [Candidatus Faecousia sp.]|nr:hypothetical protein [Candidatus Faecousia sp.]